MNTVAGTARNMGIAVKGLNDAELAEQEKEAEEARHHQPDHPDLQIHPS